MRLTLIACVIWGGGLLSSAVAREWTDSTGKFKVQADLIRVTDGKVELKKADGSLLKFPLEKLSKLDQEFLKSQESTATVDEDANSPKNLAPLFDPAKIVPLKLRPGQEAGKPGEVRSYPAGFVGTLAISPTGDMLAVGKNVEGVQLLNMNDDAVVTSVGLDREIGLLTCSLFTYDGKKLLVGGEQSLKVYDVSRPKAMPELIKFDKHSSGIGVSALAISPDSKIAATGGEKDLRAWKIEDGEELFAYDEFGSTVRACYVSQDGATVYGTDGMLLVALRLTDAKVLGKVQLAEELQYCDCAAFSPDGKWVACSYSEAIRWWDLKTGKEQPPFPHNGSVGNMAFTPDSTRLILADLQGYYVWDVKKKAGLAAVPCREGGTGEALAVSPDNQHIATFGGPAPIRVFRLPTAK